MGDFGISKILKSKNDFTSTSVGTPYYYSPELCTSSVYSFKTDIWMLGCLLYELCALDRPFPGNSYPEIINGILNEEPKPIPKHYSHFIKTLIPWLLTKDQFKRPDINQVMNLKEIRQEIEKIEKFYESFVGDKNGQNEDSLQVKRKTMSKPVSFGNLPTYSTEYQEVNQKKTMTPHFIPQEIVKDFEKNSILSLIKQINNSKKQISNQSPGIKTKYDRNPKIHFTVNEHSNNTSTATQNTAEHTNNTSINNNFTSNSNTNEINMNPSISPRKSLAPHTQMSFEKYLEQKLLENQKDDSKSKIISNIYSTFVNKPIFISKGESLEIDNPTENNTDSRMVISVINRSSEPNKNQAEMSFQEKEMGNSTEKKIEAISPEPKLSHFNNHHIINIQSQDNNMISSLNKANLLIKSKKKVLFDVEEGTIIERGRDGQRRNSKRLSPKSASITTRKNHVDWGHWVLEKMQQAKDLSQPRTILMLDFLKKRNEKENFIRPDSKNSIKNKIF